MATILIVDDHEVNRQFLVTLLGYQNHRLLEAGDGAEALALARAQPPDLVIADILMPTMDGYDLVRRLRADPQMASIPVIFYTAYYHRTEARQLAESCGVARVLTKPCDPEHILQTVEAVLGSPLQLTPPWVPPAFEQDHLRVVTDELSRTADELGIANLRLGALVEIGVHLASERDPRRMLNSVCRAARDLLGARYAMLAVGGKAGAHGVYCVTSGIDAETSASLGPPNLTEGLVGEVYARREARRMAHPEIGLRPLGLPAGHPAARCVLAAPIASLAHVYGWLCLTDKVGAGEFSDEDERLLSMLTAQVGRIYENGSLYAESQQRAKELEAEILDRRRAQEKLLESERRFSEMLRNVELLSLMLDCEARITYCNDYLLKLTGWQREEVLGRNWFDVFISPDDREVKVTFSALLAEVPEATHHENEILTRGGLHRLIRWNNMVLRSASGEVIGTASIGEDITAQKLAEDKIRRLNRVYAVLSGINTLIVRTRDRRELFGQSCRIAVEQGGFEIAYISEFNSQTRELTTIAWFGAGAESFVRLPAAGRHMPVRALLEKRAMFRNDLVRESAGGGARRQEAVRRGYRSFITLPLWVEGSPAATISLYSKEINFFTDEELTLLQELASDISFALEHISQEQQLQYLAYYDKLTGLPNRSLFLDRLAQHLHARASEKRIVAMVLFDLERFRRVNETLGHLGGDELLRLVARRLEHAFQGKEHLARVGANCFGAVVRGGRNAADVAHVVEDQILSCFREAYSVDGTELRLAARAGIALYPDDGGDADTLFRNAEAALQNAKSSGSRYLFYTAEMNARAAQVLSLETRLRKAVDGRQFVLHYQPKFELAGGAMCGMEALIRWQDPDAGLVPPGQFIPLLEETGLIVEVGRWALERALDDYREWAGCGYRVPRIAVNVSAIQMKQSNFTGTVIDVVQAAGDIPEALELEITESLMMSDIAQSIRMLSILRGMGISISMDDFGTGYSSLSYIARLPIDKVKIDRSFISGMTGNAQDMVVASTIIGLTHSLGFRAVAEGVETEEQAQALRKLKCDEAQGFLFSKPLPREQIAPLLAH